VAILSTAVLFFGGCSPSTARRPLYGRVEIDGQAITHGSISLLPAKGNSGPAANTTIIDGEYAFTNENGPHSGPHRVIIDVDTLPGNQPSEEMKASQDLKSVQPPAARSGRSAPREPPTAKRHWEFEYVVPRDDPSQKDFDLEQ